MLILGIETSCDETSVAVVEDGRIVHANLIASQVELHAQFGGVVPELASRAHIQKLIPLIDEALLSLNLTLDDVDALAVTLGPGLVGALLIGVETAKALAFAKGKSLIPVHHIAGHLYSPFLVGGAERYKLIVISADAGKSSHCGEAKAPSVNSDCVSLSPNSSPESESCFTGDNLELPLDYPYIGLVVSGGHSSLIRVDAPGQFVRLGETVDDAAGEAFDKIAKLLDLGYPGGPLVERLARTGDSHRFPLPRPMMNQPSFDFSFSGLKTAALKVVRELGLDAFKSDPQLVSDLCASFQEAVVEVLLTKAGRALEESGIRDLAVVGGVACNGRLRSAVPKLLPGIRAVFPPPVLCTDNAAMIAGLAWHYRDKYTGCDLTMNATANLPLA